ncbi:MAG: hypothetical protein HC924_15610 [Synechococcaceae cyanobacterium SM2_3_2]|nr:hypothetical protein [Synechococcaceae cyanobacterium SM2_3_2]
MDLDTRIRQANGRLKAGNVGIRIEIRRNEFYLRGILPAKPDKSHPPKQQVLSTQILANIGNLPAVEQMARRISVQLADQSFNWNEHIRAKPKTKDLPPQTIGQWIAKLDRHYQATRADTSASRNTWAKDYVRVYRELPQHDPLTADGLIHLITTTTTGSRLRIRFVNALGLLARFAGLDVELSAYLPKGKAKQPSPRDLPTDEQIGHWFHILKERDPQWSTVYGILACYGLRPSEFWHVDIDSLRADQPLLRITDGKTEPRSGILPLHPEWVEMWGLRDATMPATTTNKDPSAPISRIFRVNAIPFQPYDLRHAWAGRASAYGLDVGSAAKQMGHGVRIHEKEYGHWYTESHQRKVYDFLMSSPHKPQPPR